MMYAIRIYYLTNNINIIKRVKEKFNTTVSVNWESVIHTDEEGKELLIETERRGTIRIREINILRL